jgi:hypothetical protein
VSEAAVVTPLALTSSIRVDLLHPQRRLLRRELGDLLEEGLGVLVAGPQPFEVEDGEPAEAADLDGGRRRDDAVHRRGQQRQPEVEGVELPGDVDVLGVSRPPAGDDGDVVEPVGPSPGLADPDLDFHFAPLPLFPTPVDPR